MKASELRLGNYINIIGLVPVRVTANHIKCISEGDKQYKSIPLNEEWLSRFGLPNDDFPMIKQNNKWYATNGGIELLSDIPLEYVHQLQNFFHAIKGGELQAK